MTCSHCGQSLETDARFCPQCGTQVSIHETTVEEGNLSPIQEDGMMVSTKPRPHAKKRFGWLIIPFVVIVGVLIVGGLGGGWYYYRHNIQPQQLHEEALELVEARHYTDAILKLQQAIDLKDDETMVILLTQLESEQETIQAINEFFEALDESAKQVNQATTLAELNRICTSLSPYVEKIESLPADAHSEVASILRKVKANAHYQLFVSDYVSGDSLDELMMEAIFVPEMIVNSVKTLVGSIMNSVLEIQLPAWFESVD